MKKKIKKILKVVICVLIIILLGFAGVFGYQLSQYQKIAVANKNAKESENFKVVVKNYPAIEEQPTITNIAIKKGDKSVLKHEFVYPEKVKQENPEVKDGSTTWYYTRNSYDNFYYDSNTLLVNSTEKTFNVSEGGAYVNTPTDIMYPNTIDIGYLGADGSLYEKYLYCTFLAPYIMKMNFSTVDDNGRKAFVAEEDRGAYSSSGDDAEYTRIKTFYDNETMIPYKQVKVKPDGTEKLLKEYEITLDGITDEDVAYPDLTGYRQVLGL